MLMQAIPYQKHATDNIWLRSVADCKDIPVWKGGRRRMTEAPPVAFGSGELKLLLYFH